MTLKNRAFALLIAFLFAAAGGLPCRSDEPDGATVSFHRDILPILQARCTGCHQPAKAEGGYVMTQFERLVRGGESETPAIVPGKPDASHLVELITPENGEAAMPQGKPPLSAQEIELIRRWVAQGAVDDTPANAKLRYDLDHPPVYSLPPVITALEYSPDGQWLAIAGFHEVLLHRAEGGLITRLVGLAERVESVAFSPDGQRIAVTGGLPGRAGELQVWELNLAVKDGQASATPELVLSVPVTHDTIYGGSWSPDGKLIAVGCADNTVRAFDTETGEQVLFQGAHNDWVLDTVFSVDGKHLISVGRDMSAKLTEVATERFVDNITSITPGALKGGIQSVARHPTRDEIVIGGADGTPKVYRVFRQTPRKIGDDANLIRRLQPLKGRIFSVAVSRDGKRIAAASSLNGSGQVAIDSYEFDTGLTAELKKIMSKVATSRSAQERKTLEDYRTRGVKRLATLDFPCGVFSVAFHPDGKTLAAGGYDGQIRLIDVATGKIRSSFEAVAVSNASDVAQAQEIERLDPELEDQLAEPFPGGAKVVKLEVDPPSVALHHPFDYVQLLVTAELDSGERIDVTRMVSATLNGDAVWWTKRGTLLARNDGHADLVLSLGKQKVKVAVDVGGTGGGFQPDFIRDVAPVISKLGCNQGTCHGAAKGKNGFKLSLRGYDPIMDVRAFTDDLASRRANIASPDDSLMLLKATAAVAHMGGRVMRPGDDSYQLIREWIASGAQLNTSTPRVTAIEVLPKNPVISQIGQRQQFRVIATYADGLRRDVTRHAFITSGDGEIAKEDSLGLLVSIRRGEAPVLARFEGAYDATTLTVMGDRRGFQWREPEKFNAIDEFVADKWQRLKIAPSPLADDATFLRRIHLDLTGLPPSAEEVRSFLADSRPSQVKRQEVVDRLIGSPAYVDYWTNKWADLLMVNRKYLGAEGAVAFRNWIREEVRNNTPYDEFAKKVVTASGSNRVNPPASYYKILRDPESAMETTTQLFLAIRFNCNKCHDHPFERWTQDQYYQTAAFFAQFELKADPESKNRRIGGSAVEGAKPLYEIVQDKPSGEVIHQRTGAVAAPQFPFECDFKAPKNATRRQLFAAWLTSPDNPYFARSYVNRIWGYLTGTGLIEPLDDIRAGNPPSNPELLDYLTDEFLKSGMDTRYLMRLICQSRTYQLSIATDRWNEDDHRNYSHGQARRLPAEVIYDALHFVTGATPNLPGVPPGTRAAQLPDVGIKLPSGFLDTLGRPPRQSACECERVNDVQLGVVMALINGPVVANAIQAPNNALAKLVKQESDNRKVIEEVFLRILNRPPEPEEVEITLQMMNEIEQDHQKLAAQLKEREAWWVKRKAELEKARLAELAKAEADLKAYQQSIAPKVAQLEKQRQAKIVQAEADLKAYREKLHKIATERLTKQRSNVDWYPLAPIAVKTTNGDRLVASQDRSVIATGKANKGTYTITFRTHLPRITAFRLEALPLPGIPGGGPGLPGNGNFVVTEFEVAARPADAKAPFSNVPIATAMADFTQEGFSPAQMIDNNARDQRGWAVHPAGGVLHWATFQLKQPIANPQGTVIQIRIHQYHNAPQHRLGHFRISAASQPQPVGLSLPEALQAIAATPEKERTKEQQAELVAYYGKTDAQLIAKQQAVAEAKRPVPKDPGLVQREARIAALQKPTPEDLQLVQLKADFAASQRQLANLRLTTVQDLAWALINSPAFLFNH